MLSAFETFVTTVNRAFAVVASVLILVVALLVFYDVFSRYAFNAPSIWISDFSKFALTYIFFLGLAPALQSGHHVAVDLFETAWPPAIRRAIPRVAALATALFGLVLFWFVFQNTLRTFERNPLAQTIVPVPLKWVRVVGPIGCGQFVLTALLLILIPPRPENRGAEA